MTAEGLAIISDNEAVGVMSEASIMDSYQASGTGGRSESVMLRKSIIGALIGCTLLSCLGFAAIHFTKSSLSRFLTASIIFFTSLSTLSKYWRYCLCSSV